MVSHLDKSLNQMREELISIGGMASAKETSGFTEDPLVVRFHFSSMNICFKLASLQKKVVA